MFPTSCENGKRHNPVKMIFLVLLILCSCQSAHKKTGTLNFISVDEELDLGKSLLLEASKNLKLLRNQVILGYLNQVGQEIGLQSDWNGLTYTIHVINESDLNHFSFPGGNIFIYRGIIDSSQSVCEVALVIAHEIAHIANRDGIHRVAQKYGYAFAAQSLIGHNPEIASQIVSQLYSEGTILDYSSEEEYAADLKAIKYAWKANYDPSGILEILETIRTTESTKTALLRKTHPSTRARYKKARIEIRHAPYKSNLRKDTPEFAQIKDIIKNIPL
jgi:predicted Zn-dependent protease